MFLLSKFVMFFWDNLIYGNIMLYMSLGLMQEHLSTSASQPASHVERVHSKMKRGAVLI
jgi:hypothetical protein